MPGSNLDIVTGAFSYTGRYITQRLLDMGHEVATLTSRSVEQSPFGHRVRAMPFAFHRPEVLAAALRGATTLYNTYWVRFGRGQVTFDAAVENSRTLIKAAEQAGVERIVQVSITNPSKDSALPYFRGKALVEEAVRASTLSYAIVRPAVIYGPEDILINNIAWLLRRLPVFGVIADGQYALQPVFVEDFADLVVQVGEQRGDIVVDATGPDTFTYAEMVRLIRDTIGVKTGIVRVPPGVALLIAKLIGLAVGDVLITREEIEGLTAGLLVSHQPPSGRTRLSDWLRRNAASVGSSYTAELQRHYDFARSRRPDGPGIPRPNGGW
ncbi:MAG: NAD(P)H-binding protein [Planctomycetota bacterium]|jgi:NADH dehydrogenase